jgi:hypothetical protein
MQYDPYAAPQHAPPPGPFGAPPAGNGPQPWELGEVLSTAWRLFSQNAVVLIFAPIIMSLIVAIPLAVLSGIGLMVLLHGNLDPTAFQRPEYLVPIQGGVLVLTVIVLLVQSFFEVGLLRIYLAAARGETPSFGLLFSGGSRYPSMLGLMFLLQIPTLLTGAVRVGGMASRDPALILGTSALYWAASITMLVLLGLGLFFARFFVADGNSGPIQAIKEGWAACAGQRGSVFLFAVVAGLIAMAGGLACCVGFFVTYPFAFVACAVVYTRITGRGPSAAMPAYPAPPPPPAFGAPPGTGYGGPPGYPPAQ